MSLDNPAVIDAVGIEKSTGHIILTIIDEWDWQDEASHLFALQNKINAYLEFVASGQVYEVMADTKGKQIRIDIISRVALPAVGEEFIRAARTWTSPLNIDIQQSIPDCE